MAAKQSRTQPMDRVEIGLLCLDEAEPLTDLAGRIWHACYLGMPGETGSALRALDWVEAILRDHFALLYSIDKTRG